MSKPKGETWKKLVQYDPKVIKLNRELAKLRRSEQQQEAVELFHEKHRKVKADEYSVSTTVTACAHLNNLTLGTQLHSLCIKSGLVNHLHVSNTLLSLYAKSPDFLSLKRAFYDVLHPDVYSHTTFLSACVKSGHLDFAFYVFDRMPVRDVEVWNAIITGCVHNRNHELGFRLFRDMCSSGVVRDGYSFASVLSACYGLDFGRQLHSFVLKVGFFSRTSVVNALITMYFNCDEVSCACSVFHQVEAFICNEISYNVMIDGLVSSGRVKEGLVKFRQLLGMSLKPTELTFMSVLSSCSCAGDGSQFHALVIKMGFEAYTSVSNVTMLMYSSCGDLHSAHSVFTRLDEKDLVSWNTLMSSYSQGKFGASAVMAYKQMRIDGIEPDEFTFGSLLASLESIEVVETVHGVSIRNGLSSNVGVSNALISVYSRHGDLDGAYRIFRDMICKNLISWNTMISGFQLNGLAMDGLKLAYELLSSSFKPDEYTLTIILSICSSISASRQGKQVHGYILRTGIASTCCLGNVLVTMYAKCGLLDWSIRVFNSMPEKDVVSWNASISAYGQHGLGKEALSCFQTMQNSSQVKPDRATFSAILSACSHSGLVDEGMQIFRIMVDEYNVKPEVEHFSCIVDLLGRAGHVQKAATIINSNHFESHPDVLWTLFGACVSHGNLSLGRSVARLLLRKDQDNPSVYVVLSNIYAAAGLWEEAANVRVLMDNIGGSKQPGYSLISS